MGRVYLLHFERPISDKHTCQHYLGYTSRKLRERIDEHRKGWRSAARLTQVAHERDISFKVVKTWPGTRQDERRLKAWKNAVKKLCPLCAGKPIRGYLRRYNETGR